MYESSSGTPGVAFTHGMGLLAQALDVLTGVDPTELDPAVLGEAVLTLTGQSRRLGAVQSMVSDRFAASGAWGDAGAKSAYAWVASQSNEAPNRIISSLSTGTAMRAHPVMAAAFAAGRVSARHVDVLARAAHSYPTTRPSLDAAADELVDIAGLMTAGKFSEYLEAFCHMIDPGAVEKDERKRDSEAYLHLSKIADGMWRLDGLLPDEVGTQFKAVLNAVRRRLRAEAKSKERAEEERTDKKEPSGGNGIDPLPEPEAEFANESAQNEGSNVGIALAKSDSEVVGIDVLGNPIHADETPTEAMDHRFGSRHNVDALRFIVNLVASAKNLDGTIAIPSVNGARPVVHLTVDIEALLEDSESKAAAWLERFGVPASVISAAKAKLLACDAHLEPLIVRDGQLVATLPTLATVPAHLRKAVLRRDQQCRINSCTSPIDEVHHLTFVSRGGLTTMDNLAGLCWFHHQLIHQEKWTLTGDANHSLTLTNTTTGQRWTNRPPPKHGP